MQNPYQPRYKEEDFLFPRPTKEELTELRKETQQKLLVVDTALKLIEQHRKNPKKEKICRQLCEHAAANHKVFAKIWKRNLQCGSGYPSNIQVLTALAEKSLEEIPSLYNKVRAKQFQETIGTGLQWDNAVKFDIPLSRVHPEIFEMILNCKPPKDIPLWEEQTTPRFPSQYYILPDGSFQINGQDIPVLALTVMKPEELEEQTETIQRRTGGLYTNLVPENEGLFLVTAHTNKSDEISVIRTIRDGILIESEQIGKIQETDKILLSIGVQILLLENVHPEWNIEEKQSFSTGGSGKRTPEYRPRTLGGNFPKTKFKKTGDNTPSSEDDRKKPCEHWRGSHWRTVHFGEKCGQSKRKLILPCIVNPGVE